MIMSMTVCLVSIMSVKIKSPEPLRLHISVSVSSQVVFCGTTLVNDMLWHEFYVVHQSDLSFHEIVLRRLATGGF